MRVFPFLIVILLLSNCKVEEVKNDGFKPKFIIEGNIEVEDYPVVKITHNLPINAKLNEAQLEEIIIRWAKVEVFSETDSEILTLIHEKKNFPYYFYKGRRLKGELGGHYRVKVTYNDIIMEGETSIPLTSGQIDSIWFKTALKDTSRRELNVKIKDSSPLEDYYRFYVQEERNIDFAATTPNGVEDSKFINNQFESILYRKRLANYGENVSPYFMHLDTIVVKVSNMDPVSSTFWKQYTDIDQAIPLLGGTKPLIGNMTGPCIGIWYGTASDYRRVVVK